MQRERAPLRQGAWRVVSAQEMPAAARQPFISESAPPAPVSGSQSGCYMIQCATAVGTVLDSDRPGHSLIRLLLGQAPTSTRRPATARPPSTRLARTSTRMWWSFCCRRAPMPTRPTRTACSRCTSPPRRATTGQPGPCHRCSRLPRLTHAAGAGAPWDQGGSGGVRVEGAFQVERRRLPSSRQA